MVSIAKADLGMNVITKFVLMHGFHRRRCANGHEDGGIDRAMVGFDLAGAGAGMGVGVEEGEIHNFYAKFRLLSNFNSTAIIKVNPISEEPPALINGSGIPMVGIRPMVIPILITTCTKIIPATE